MEVNDELIRLREENASLNKRIRIEGWIKIVGSSIALALILYALFKALF